MKIKRRKKSDPWKFRCPICYGSNYFNVSGFDGTEGRGVVFDCRHCLTEISVQQSRVPKELYA